MVEHTSRRQGIMQRMEIIDERNEMRDMIKELGGEDPLNIIKSYLGQEDPRVIEGRYRSGKSAMICFSSMVCGSRPFIVRPSTI